MSGIWGGTEQRSSSESLMVRRPARCGENICKQCNGTVVEDGVDAPIMAICDNGLGCFAMTMAHVAFVIGQGLEVMPPDAGAARQTGLAQHGGGREQHRGRRIERASSSSLYSLHCSLFSFLHLLFFFSFNVLFFFY